MKKLYPLLIVSLSLNSDRPFWDVSAGGDVGAIALSGWKNCDRF